MAKEAQFTITVDTNHPQAQALLRAGERTQQALSRRGSPLAIQDTTHDEEMIAGKGYRPLSRTVSGTPQTVEAFKRHVAKRLANQKI